MVDTGIIVGDMCHIKGDRPVRHVTTLSNLRRSGSHSKNVILLCPTHHRMVDGDEATYTAEVLIDMKADHEERFRNTRFSISNVEAMRLAFFGGTGVGAVLTDIAKTVVDAIGTVAPKPQAEAPPPTISDFLQSVPPGAIGYCGTSEIANTLGSIVSDVFKSHRWKTTKLVVPMPPEHLLVVFEHRRPNSLEVVTLCVFAILRQLGFRPVEGDAEEWKKGGASIYLSIVKEGKG